MTSTCINLGFLIKGISYFLIKTLFIKEIEAPKSNNAKTLWFLSPKHTSIVKQGEKSEIKIGNLLNIAHDSKCSILIIAGEIYFLTHYLLWQLYSLFCNYIVFGQYLAMWLSFSII